MKITRYFKTIRIENKLLRNYYTLAFIRLCLVFVPQIGYIHPDEFFQSVEVMAGKFSYDFYFQNCISIKVNAIFHF